MIFSVALGLTAKAQQPAIPPATNAVGTNGLGKIAEIRAKAEKGDAAAQTELGLMCERGNDVPQDYAEAAKWYRKAAEQGYARAQRQLGDMYDIGQGVNNDEAEAVKWWHKAADQYRKSAEQGNADAQWELGGLHFRLHYADTNYTYAEGLKLVRKAAEQGNADAQNQLGFKHSLGVGFPQDSAEGLKWYRKAADQGNSDAEDSLGDAYSTGEGVATNFSEAVKWWLKAAEQGDASAQHSLGDAYSAGEGVATNQVEAAKWYRKAAQQGNAHRQCDLGEYYYYGWSGFPQDYAEAVKWFRKAANQGQATAQNDLGECYRFGDGVPQDCVEAVKWYLKAAEQGNVGAQRSLGSCYFLGQGVAQDYAEAMTWYRKAAEQGDADAGWFLGTMHELGQGVSQDYIQAYKWYNLAAAQNQTNAIQNRDRISDSMTPSQIAEGQRLSREFVPPKVNDLMSADEFLKKQGVPVVGDVPRFTGTGFFVTGDGCLLTCYHVVEDASRITVRTTAGTFVATLVKADKANDVALLKVTGKFSALPVGSSRGMKLGESVFTIGFPNIGLQGFAPKLTKGEISSLTGMQDDPRYFQISAAVQPGNSGGALVDDRGNVVGVVSAKLDAATALAASGALPENVNYAIKSSLVLSFLESVPEVAGKMKEPGTKEEIFEAAVNSAEQAAVLVLIY